MILKQTRKLTLAAMFFAVGLILPFFIDNAQQFLVKKSLRRINYGQINDYHLPSCNCSLYMVA